MKTQHAHYKNYCQIDMDTNETGRADISSSVGSRHMQEYNVGLLEHEVEK